MLRAGNGYSREVLDCVMRQWPVPTVPSSFHRHAERSREKARECEYFRDGIAQHGIDTAGQT